MIGLLTAETMQRLERECCGKLSIETRLLMENAGGRVAEEAAQLIVSLNLKRVFVVCGVGNNGGDCLVVARHLRSRFPNLEITVYLVGEKEKMAQDTASNYTLLTSLNVEIREIGSVAMVEFKEHSLIIDALFGTGLKKAPQGIFAEIIRKINQSSCVVLSVDVPSGVDATSGFGFGEAVRAHLTVTMGKFKQGLVQFPAREYVGRLKLVDIGIPLGEEADAYLLTPQDIVALLPERDWSAHKISAGVLGVVAGSSAMLGAGILLSLAAYQIGTGMVVWPLSEEHSSLVKTVLPELVSVVIPRRGFTPEFHYSLSDVDTVKRAMETRKCRCLAVGPGLGGARSTVFFIERLLEEVVLGGVLDADALNIIAQNRDRWKGKLASWILTPHAGEMSRLLGISIEELNRNRIFACRECSKYFGSVTVLKGAGTVIASPEGKAVVNPTGSSNLATAGSGDVLTGIIGGLMAQGLGLWESALCGV
ncbi:MAG: NAD(P)H-hydrate epimerase, partial [Atribacterota bacterium]|nr:NAD(P)H-hydrate epimerase [Atribacterota bacterium]